MAVTIKEIAEACQVSRGTVDRVLNHRKGVKKETKELVEKTAQALGYRPNTTAKALAARKKNYAIGVIINSEGIEFYKEVLKGINHAIKKMEDYGIHVFIQTMKGYSSEKQIDAIEKMSERVQFLILNGINDERVAEKIRYLKNQKIPTLTLNTDVENSQRLCYVGCNYEQSGKMAAGVIRILGKEKIKIAIATGSSKILGHNQRVHGFISICKENASNMEIIDIIETNDDDEYAYQQLLGLLARHNEINAIYIAAAGTAGVCKAVQDLQKQGEISIIASDSTDSVKEWMKKGLIKATICQQPWMQGYQAVVMAMEYLGKGIAPKEDFIIKNEIKILENIE